MPACSKPQESCPRLSRHSLGLHSLFRHVGRVSVTLPSRRPRGDLACRAMGLCGALGVAFICLAPLAASATPHGVAIEATNSYSSCGITPDLSQCVREVQLLWGYLSEPVASIHYWTKFLEWDNYNAWDTDMQDSDVVSGGSDVAILDNPGVSISMYAGHGVCSDQSIQTCTVSSNCTTPAPGQSLPGFCTRHPGASSGHCMYFAPRIALTCGSGDSFGHYSNLSTGGARFGESAVSGPWAGAGTNGNVDFLMFDISCGATPGQEVNDYWNAFAGAHIISTIMPTELNSDTLDTSARGAIVGNDAFTSINSSASLAWIDSIHSIGGSACGGAGGGLTGCGANISFSVAQNESYAEYLNGTESFKNLPLDSDPTGAGWMSWIYACNYDCSLYPTTY
jgi:Family of unknown function (DUF6345)